MSSTLIMITLIKGSNRALSAVQSVLPLHKNAKHMKSYTAKDKNQWHDDTIISMLIFTNMVHTHTHTHVHPHTYARAHAHTHTQCRNKTTPKRSHY